MTLALDDMVGELLDYLERTGRAEHTLVVFTSDHGSQVGAQGVRPWSKKHPYQASLHVPCILRLPGVLEGGRRRDTLTSPVDLMPSLCSLCGVPIPRTVEGHDLSAAWRGVPGAFEQEAVLTMNFSSRYDWIGNGQEWRGVRTRRYNYAAWLDGRRELYDLERDPLEMRNLADAPQYSAVQAQLEETKRRLQAQRGDVLGPCEMYRDWFDSQRRVVRNAYGPLSHPEGEPDWSLLA
jgi:arylsulfatase A-like enzyme